MKIIWANRKFGYSIFWLMNISDPRPLKVYRMLIEQAKYKFVFIFNTLNILLYLSEI